MTINENDYAFGLDGSRYWSTNGLADFKICAQATNPIVRFVATRAVISWGYTDSFFAYHWAEIAKMAEYRKALVTGMPDDFYMPVGRMAYGVIYPGEDPKKQAYHLLKVVIDQGADWTHDRLVIDAELHHNQGRTRITQAINEYGNILKAETGKLPILYTRYYWLRDNTIINSLLPFDMWYAQYLRAIPGVRYRKEYPCPPNPIFENRGWMIHQTAERGDPRPYGVTGKQVIDYDRWNGGWRAVADFFSFGEPPSLELTDKEKLYILWDAHPELHP